MPQQRQGVQRRAWECGGTDSASRAGMPQQQLQQPLLLVALSAVPQREPAGPDSNLAAAPGRGVLIRVRCSCSAMRGDAEVSQPCAGLIYHRSSNSSSIWGAGC